MYATDRTARLDFDGDGKTDISVYRLGEWTVNNRAPSVFYALSSQTGQTLVMPWGLGGDRPTPADYDNDGITDVAIFRSWEDSLEFPWEASDYWIKYSSGGYDTNYFLGYGLLLSRNYFGDGKAERAVHGSRAVSQEPEEPCYILGFLISYEENTFQKDITDACVNSSTSRTPAIGDYNNDGYSDIAMFVKSLENNNEPSYFELWNSPQTSGFTAPDAVVRLKVDFPIPGDYDGDGKTDFAGGVIENNRLVWRIKKSSTGAITKTVFGLPGDRPVPGDYDGDGKTDLAVFRAPYGLWYILRSSDGNWQVSQFGIPTDILLAQPNAS